MGACDVIGNAMLRRMLATSKPSKGGKRREGEKATPSERPEQRALRAKPTAPR